MQLKSLYIKDYKILKDFTIEFPYDYKRYISVFIGANGSGKSTILEAIAQIFSFVFLSKETKFDFKIEYSIKSSDVLTKFSINNTKLKNIPVKITGDSGYMPQAEISFELIPPEVLNHADTHVKLSFAQRDFRDLMPDNIVIYYSGLSTEMEKLCSKHEEIQKDEFKQGNYTTKRRFFYFRPENFSMLLLSLFSYEFGDIKDYVHNKLGITELSGFLIKLKRPEANWAKGKKPENIWGAKGALKDFCNVLGRFAKFTTYEENGDSIEFHFPSCERLYSIKNHYGEERKLFELLDMAFYEGILDKIELSLNKGTPQNCSIPQDSEISFESHDLSEGEQQIIAIKGLTDLLSGKNTLFLFDEPDTYLHPEWQRQFITEIQETIENTDSENTYIIATHSPNIVSGIKRENLSVIDKGAIKEIPFNSFGKNVDSLLIDFFDVEGVRNIYVENLLMEIQSMVKKKLFNSPEFKAKFQELKDILSPTAQEIVDINIEIAKSRKK